MGVTASRVPGGDGATVVTNGFEGAELYPQDSGEEQQAVTAVISHSVRPGKERELACAEREKLLDEGRQYFSSYDVRKIGSAFSGWFRFGGRRGRDSVQGDEEGIPSNWKQAMSVVLALFPTVMVLDLTVGKDILVFGLTTD